MAGLTPADQKKKPNLLENLRNLVPGQLQQSILGKVNEQIVNVKKKGMAK